MAEPTVRMSGIVLASLMFQHVNSDSDVVRVAFAPLKLLLYCFQLTLLGAQFNASG